MGHLKHSCLRSTHVQKLSIHSEGKIWLLSLSLHVFFFSPHTVWVTWTPKLRSFVKWILVTFYDCVFFYIVETWKCKWEFPESRDYKGWLTEVESHESRIAVCCPPLCMTVHHCDHYLNSLEHINRPLAATNRRLGMQSDRVWTQ